MVSIAFKLQALPEKRQELMQTLAAIMDETAAMEDCINCALQQDPENLNAVTLVIEWRAQKAFHSYQQSEQFRVLLGAFNLLCISKMIQYNTLKV